ncbi:MAG: dockerin type I domain-containing protein, partial [Clostridiales Family XIII bacterium]|nr:dockerin type I domain-containing protein [Clostridiales Family XIII bacterium]
MKRVILILLILSLLCPPGLPALAADNPAFSIEIAGTIDTVAKFNGQNTFAVSWQLKANKPNLTLNNTQGIRIAYDNTVLQLIRWDASSPVNEPLPGEDFVLRPDVGKTGDLGSSIDVFTAKSADSKTGYISASVGSVDDLHACPQNTYVNLGEFRFAFKSGKGISDLADNSIRVMNASELFAFSQSYAVLINDNQDNSYTYGNHINGAAQPAYDTLNAPTVSIITEAPPEPTVRVSSAAGRAGEELTLAVSLENNPGIISMGFNIIFNNEALKLVGIENTGRLNRPLHPPHSGRSPIRFTWNDGDSPVNNTNNGEIVILKFEVLKDTNPGEYEIGLEIVEGTILDALIQQVKFRAASGNITVSSFTFGDVNDDTLVNMADSVILMRYTAGWNFADIMPGLTSINLKAADVNDDTSVNMSDSVILMRHTAGWPDYAVFPWKPPAAPQAAAFGLQALSSDAPTISVAEGRGLAGDIIQIPISLENNPGIVTMGFNIIFDNKALRLVNAENTGKLNRPLHPQHNGTSPIRFTWNDGDSPVNNTNNGDIVVLNFEVLADALPGEYEIKLEIVSGSILNAFIQQVPFETVSGRLTVESDEVIDAQAPVIETQPRGAAVTVSTGDDATHDLNVTATSPDGGSLAYQWYSNISAVNSDGILIPGANNATYTAPTGTVGTYYYYVVITNIITDNGDGGVKTANTASDVATLTVTPLPNNAEAPIIETQPQGAAVTVGVSYDMTVAATSLDGGTLSYQWYSNTSAVNSGGALIPGATNATYTAPTGIAGTYYYYVVVTNTIIDNGDGGAKIAMTTSDVVTLSVASLPINAEAPDIATQPQDAVVTVGVSYDMTVAATSLDGGTLSYQWYSNTSVDNSGGALIPGATDTTYVAPTGTVGTYYYYVVVTNTITDNGDGGVKTATTTSDVVTLTVTPLPINAEVPSITTQPQDAVVTVGTGDDATHDLNVAATSPDGGSLAYQWYSNTSATNVGGALISGATDENYMAPTDTVGTYYYYVTI